MGKPARCPKCKSRMLQIVDHLVVPEIHYQNVDGEVTMDKGESERCYSIKRVGLCLQCGHRWRIRKQLWEIGGIEVQVPPGTDTTGDDFRAWLNGHGPKWWERTEKEE